MEEFEKQARASAPSSANVLSKSIFLAPFSSTRTPLDRVRYADYPRAHRQWLASGRGSVPRDWAASVSACATCDGFFFQGGRPIFAGGGDTGDESDVPHAHASKVTVIHRRDKLRASQIMQQKAFANDKIEFLWDTEIREVLGAKDAGVTGLRIFNKKTGEESVFPCEGFFVAIGHKPNTDIFRGWLELDEVGYIKTAGRSMATNIPGVFACGDAQDSFYRQAVTAAGTGCMAAIDAERYLDNLPVPTPTGEEITIDGDRVSPHEIVIMADARSCSTNGRTCPARRGRRLGRAKSLEWLVRTGAAA